MRKIIFRFFIFIVLVSFSGAFLSSCVSQKKIKYLQKKQKEDTTTFFLNKQAQDYKIQPNDNLYINIYSLDEKTNSIINRSTGTSNISSGNMYFQSYTVSIDGYIEFPVIGKVFVRDLTMDQTKVLLQQLIDEYLKETIVVVKMAIFNITMLGEVRSPGTRPIYMDKINIFEAISMFGDLSDFANRREVVLVRQVKNTSKIYYIDVTSDKLLSSELYYLAPNDILYFAPLRAKQFGFATFPYGFAMGMISFAISTYLLIVSLAK